MSTRMHTLPKNGAHTPSQQIQSMYDHMLHDPSLSQASIFKSYTPLVLVAYVLISSAILLRKAHKPVYEIITQPTLQVVRREAKGEIGWFALLVVGGGSVLVVVLFRVVLWVAAMASRELQRQIVSPTLRKGADSDGEEQPFQLSGVNAVLGGMM